MDADRDTAADGATVGGLPDRAPGTATANDAAPDEAAANDVAPDSAHDSAAPDGAPTDGSVPPVDVAARLRMTATQRPDHPALVWDGGRLTYGELHARVDAGTAALQALGVAPGDRVALVAGTTPAFVEVAAAVLRAGAILVPLLPGLAPDELRHALADSGASVAVVGPERVADVAALAADLDGLQVIPAAGAHLEGHDDWDALVSRDGRPRVADRRPDDLAAIVYTSGTTGRPRGAMLSRGNLAANQDQSLAGRFEVGPDDVVLLVLPLAHIYSFNVGLGAAMSVGATLVLVERFDPDVTLRAMVDHDVTVVLGAPGMYVAWLRGGHLDDVRLPALRLAVSGAAPLPPAALEGFAALTGVTIEEGYGLTEASPSVTSNAMGDAPRAGSVGLPLPGVEVRLVDDTGHDVAEGDPGEVWVRGPNVFQGYWSDPDATAEVLTTDGWLRTGDVATRDQDGYLYLVDRKRDLIIVNGFNVYPREVERVLLEDDEVLDAAVVGAEHPLTGETVVAYVVPRRGQVDSDHLGDLCRANLARYKCPTRFEVVEALPATATGKVRRRELRGRERP
ncbi:AMP-binding protein [Egicoccus sp. AB-alg2]|uniref:AMP-binding protein n=1 Tax=Egicoccus sp. AB-alg2 TaxID=3242693 RepID=UPI00359E786C